MKKLTFLLVLVALLIVSTAIVYAGWQWDSDPVGVWSGGKAARVLVNSGATVTFYNATSASRFPGVTVEIDTGGKDRVCVTGSEFEVIPNKGVMGRSSGLCVAIDDR